MKAIRLQLITKRIIQKKYAKNHQMIRIMMACLFLLYIIVGATGLVKYVSEANCIEREVIESYFQDINYREEYVELYGAAQRILGKRQIENFTIFKNNYNKLVLMRPELTEEDIELKIDDIQPIWQNLQQRRIPFLYVKSLFPVADVDDLPYGAHEYSHENSAILYSKMPAIDVLDLDNIIGITKESRFYRTDHHWTGDSCFETYQMIVDWCVKNEVLDKNDLDTAKNENFKRETVKGFLGSYGIKVGQYYNGKDVLNYYSPLFETDFTYKMCNADGELQDTFHGSWSEALIDNEILEDSGYNNKYNCFLYGNDKENQIINNDVAAGKLLVISHSYGRPLAQLLALHFHETHQIDPQEGRFNGNYLEYIDKYNPDVVIFMVESEGQIAGNYKTESVDE